MTPVSTKFPDGYNEFISAIQSSVSIKEINYSYTSGNMYITSIKWEYIENKSYPIYHFSLKIDGEIVDDNMSVYAREWNGSYAISNSNTNVIIQIENENGLFEYDMPILFSNVSGSLSFSLKNNIFYGSTQSTTGEFTLNYNVVSNITLIGGGGGGSAGYVSTSFVSYGGQGGGGGGVIGIQSYPVNLGGTIGFEIGAKGTSIEYNISATNGKDTILKENNSIIATAGGGHGGQTTSNERPKGGTTMVDEKISKYATCYVGGSGGYGYPYEGTEQNGLESGTNYGNGGGGGGSTYGGMCGDSNGGGLGNSSGNSDGMSATHYGCGGGGSMYGSPHIGGNGASGMMYIEIKLI
jgi:hypothetical protein